MYKNLYSHIGEPLPLVEKGLYDREPKPKFLLQ